MAKFEALELARELRALIDLIKRHDANMADQLQRAGTSAPSCLSEGSMRTGKDRLHLYRTSSGSAAEIHTQLQLAVAWRYVTSEQAAAAVALDARTIAITWRLT